MMTTIEILFWIAAFIVFYTYIGYGILLYLLVKLKELFVPNRALELPAELPEVTLLIAAYNEQDIVREKMANCDELDYPTDKLKIVWITDGTTDNTNKLLTAYDNATVLFEQKRGGKAAAFNRAMPFVETPIVVYTDANTMLCKEAITEIVRTFVNPKVGCVSGEKRVAMESKQGATAGEGLYWKYESKLKELDHRLYSTVGAAGELFAIRTNLYEALPSDTLLDDFVLSIKIAQRGYRIAYCQAAYAVELASADITQEAKRKVRIAAGGIQSVWRLRSMLNIFRHGLFSFQYVSHKVLRWTLAPFALFALLPLNIILVVFCNHWILVYDILLSLHILFYGLGVCGYILSGDMIRNKFIFVPYYFLFMNVCVLRSFAYLRKHKGSGTWEKAKRVTADIAN